MPTLKTADGTPVDVTPPDPDAVNAAFNAAMNDDGPDEQAPPKRQRREPAADGETRPRRGRPPKEEKSRTVTRPAVTLDDDARAQGVAGIAQVVAGIALMGGRASGSSALQADGMVIASAAPQFADACVQIAKVDAAFAARLDKVVGVGPYGALVAVLVTAGLQIARNHKPALQLPGTVDPMELLTAPEHPDTETAAA